MKEEIRELIFALAEKAMERGLELDIEQKDTKNEFTMEDGQTRTFVDNGFSVRIFRYDED